MSTDEQFEFRAPCDWVVSFKREPDDDHSRIAGFDDWLDFLHWVTSEASDALSPGFDMYLWYLHTEEYDPVLAIKVGRYKCVGMIPAHRTYRENEVITFVQDYMHKIGEWPAPESSS